ncbi:sensor histidine kinase [Bacteroides pyogenes]|uniref:sensor histidine kinase n=1 Tax=Bacteroides pyogenes TaxID=310300 RepID=UPI001BAAB495|nr:HAMP domain-containing sensor histidine kinase [Bacteroides pyogenes]MBR8739994.1 Adaptive-response sensory-kinase SasA [Bacteroides pyogenes]MBR8755764.1 Adaptive-response sensory-kinase SasA [Bacteroides pyogenes]MBR8794036.1 Adaptive-response sensory-kinase SasA [Bacteroides pyogenes]MBR8797083.1 Adaptive-response sensory-kinase SasA [Bacteroides pyogenes]MBR8810677.1 Adaptive-response sensory-kinase SasA [Bacteroides pyogenes]
MKRNYASILFATTLALIALLVSQSLWLSYASKQDNYEQNIAFVSCFNQSISSIIRDNMETEKNVPFTTIKPIDSVSLERIMKEKKPRVVDAGDIKEGGNVAIMIENALIALKINERKFDLSGLDTLITTSLNEEERNVVSSYITLQDTKANKVLEEIKREHIPVKKTFFVKTYTAERKIEIPTNSYLITAEYQIKQPSYLKRLGIVTVVSFLASIIIVSVLFYLLLMINRRYIEVANMERSFHGAIHDLKSPLAYVYFKISSLEEKETDITKQSALALTGQRVNYLTDKIMRLLTAGQNLNKIPENTKQSVWLYDILEQIESEVRTMFPAKTIEFENEIIGDLYLWGVPDLLEAALRILIENAVKYNNNAPTVKINAARDNECIIIEVVDDGIGIYTRQLKHLFKPYYTSDTKHGTGIGLYYAKRIITAHGGKIFATSTPGKGSTFTINLPTK